MPENTDSKCQNVLHKRRYFQFSLRILLMVLLIFGCAFGWISYQKRNVQKEWSAISEFRTQKLGHLLLESERRPREAFIQRAFAVEQSPCVISAMIDISTVGHTTESDRVKQGIMLLAKIESVEAIYVGSGGGDIDEELAPLSRFSHLHTLGVSGSNHFTGEGMRHFSGSLTLESLSFEDSASLTSNGFQSLRGLPKLRVLNVNRSIITTESIKHIADCITIEELFFCETSLTKGALEHLKKMPSLTLLDVWATNVSDADLLHIANIKSLKEVNVYHTAVSQTGFEWLKKKRPDLKVIWMSPADSLGK